MKNELRLWSKKAGSIMAMLIDHCGLKNTKKNNVCFFVLCLLHVMKDFKLKRNTSSSKMLSPFETGNTVFLFYQ